MNEMQLLKKYSARRKRWHKWDFYAKDSDLQNLRRLENACWTLLIIFAVSIQRTLDSLFDDTLLDKIGTGYVLCFMAYLFYELHRTQKLRALFERSAVQNSDALIEQLENTSTEQPASPRTRSPERRDEP